MNKTYEQFELEASAYDQILEDYKTNGKVFVDPHFHPQKKIHETNFEFIDSEHKWIRIDELYKAPLFKKDLISPDQIKLGELGDYYFLETLARVAKQPDLVPLLFDRSPNYVLGQLEDSINIQSGAVVIYFYAFGRRTPVLIDTLIPCQKYTTFPCFSHPDETSMSPWFCLVEKAFAKLMGSYSNIIHFTPIESIYHLFGFYPTLKYLRKLTKRGKSKKMSPYQRLLKYRDQKAVMTVSINLQRLPETVSCEDVHRNKLNPGEEYLILDIKEADDKHFISLRDPWKKHVWEGPYSRSSNLWTPELQEALGANQEDESVFWMIEDDFFNYFTSLKIARPVSSNWHMKCSEFIMAPGPYDGWDIEKQEARVVDWVNYVIKIDRPIPQGLKCRLIVQLERYRNRALMQNEEFQNPQYHIIFGNSNGRRLTHDIVKRSDHMTWVSRADFATFEYIIESHEEITTMTIHRIEKADFPEKCVIRVSSKYEFTMNELGSRPVHRLDAINLNLTTF